MLLVATACAADGAQPAAAPTTAQALPPVSRLRPTTTADPAPPPRVWPAGSPVAGQPRLEPGYVPAGLSLTNEFLPGEWTPPPEPNAPGAVYPPTHHRLYAVPRGAPTGGVQRYVTINVYYGPAPPSLKLGGVTVQVRGLPARLAGPDVRSSDIGLRWERPDGLVVDVGAQNMPEAEALRVAESLE